MPRTSVFFNDDINIADFRILLYIWDREKQKSEFLVDISSLSTSNIHISKERNKPDTLTVTIEYTQFKNKLQYEGSEPQNILMPFLTEVKIQRNFETIFAGTLFHLNLRLGEIGREEVELKCCSWGEHFEKRYVSEGFKGTYPQIARQMVRAGQHELNWFDNYAFEYTDEYFQGWEWSAATDNNPNPPRSNPRHWEGGIYLTNGQYATTYSMTPNNTMAEVANKYNLPQMYFSFYYRANNCSSGSCLRLRMAGDNNNAYGTTRLTFDAPVSNQTDWVKYEGTIPATNIVEDIHWLRIQAVNANIDFSDLQLYIKPTNGDAYDLDIDENGVLDTQGHVFDNQRVRHYHRQNIKDALYNIAKLSNSMGTDSGGNAEPDTFEYEFDENKKFNIYYKQGLNIADPAFSATYPGIIKSLSIERGLEDISNINYAEAQEQKTIKDKEGNEQTITKNWNSAYSSGGSMARFGAMADFKSFEAVHSYSDLNEVGGSELNIFDEVVDVPEIEVDSNIYNMGNVFLGDTIIVNVLSDPLFSFINGTYRVYSFEADISQDSVEKMRLTLLPPDRAAMQLISFPVDYKYIKNDLKRLSTGANR